MYKFNPDAVMSGFARGGSDRPMTMEDVQARQERLKALGLDNSLLGDLNAMAGQAAQFRGQLKGQAMDSLLSSLGGSEAALGSAAGSAASSGALAAAL